MVDSTTHPPAGRPAANGASVRDLVHEFVRANPYVHDVLEALGDDEGRAISVTLAGLAAEGACFPSTVRLDLAVQRRATHACAGPVRLSRTRAARRAIQRAGGLLIEEHSIRLVPLKHADL